MIVKRIEREMTYQIRHCVLRQNQPFDACKFETDNIAGTFHLGAFLDDKLVSIATFCPEKQQAFTVEKQMRLRAMATLDQYRLQGAGSAIISYAESMLEKDGIAVLWCNARTSAQGYYHKLGFKTHGDVFDYPPIGPHIVMYKVLSI